MRRKHISLLIITVLSVFLLTGCGNTMPAQSFVCKEEIRVASNFLGSGIEMEKKRYEK